MSLNLVLLILTVLSATLPILFLFHSIVWDGCAWCCEEDCRLSSNAVAVGSGKIPIERFKYLFLQSSMWLRLFSTNISLLRYLPRFGSLLSYALLKKIKFHLSPDFRLIYAFFVLYQKSPLIWVVHQEILSFIDSNSLLFNYQSGFQPHHSTGCLQNNSVLISKPNHTIRQ